MIQSLKESIEAELSRLLPAEAGNPLYAAARYSLLAPAKRIRPLFTLLISQLFDPNSLAKAMRPACALELIHTYSLIHDDLPCMDDDDFRRGQPSLHRVYNEGHAILVGDFLLTFAFEVLAEAPALPSSQKIDLIRILSKAAGANGMVGGQVLDLSGTSDSTTLNLLKTAALFQAAFKFGGIITNVSSDILNVLETLGTHVGLLFQLVDDLLDGEKSENPVWAHHYESAFNTLDALPSDKEEVRNLISSIIEPLPYDTQISAQRCCIL
ncbi:MAG TPA: polyprenyl synthetase family protein [Myxococcota bacterium]|nr:polyprenyl synthetase family protein [Myxococcota bacterium]